MSRIVKFLESKNIYLRPFNDNDLDLLHFGKNNAEVRETLFLFYPMTKEEIKNQIEEWIKSKDTTFFTVCEQETNEPIGETGLFRIDHISRAAVFYIAIHDPKYWSKGYGSQTTQLMLKYSFDILNLNRVQLHVSVENEKGVKAYEKVGFKIEGTLRQAMYHNNKYVDFYVMGLLREEYYKL